MSVDLISARSGCRSRWFPAHAWYSCWRYVIRRFRQSLFFAVVIFCGMVVVFGHIVFTNTYTYNRFGTDLTLIQMIKYGDVWTGKNVASIEVLRRLTPPSTGSNRQRFGVNPNVEETSALTRWKSELKMTAACNSRMELYANSFARLNGVVIDRHHCIARSRGGEEIQHVLQQNELDEYYTHVDECFQLDCSVRSHDVRNDATVEREDLQLRWYRFEGVTNYLNDWLKGMKKRKVDNITDVTVDTNFTIALTRHEYANLYHTATDWYNSFLLMTFFNRTASDTNILFVDAHPKGHLDSAWSTLFRSVRYLYELPTRTLFTELVWGIQGYNSPIKKEHAGQVPPPFLEEFRDFFLSGFNIKKKDRKLNCSAVSVLFLWRRDYVAHPRNPSGVIQRKIENEAEILSHLQITRKDLVVKGVQIDLNPIGEQLQLIADADILIGMHGAGLAHVLFLPKHGALVEMFPSYYPGINRHMGNFATWRGMPYVEWHAIDRINELRGFRTIIPPNIVARLLDGTKARICSLPEPKLTGEDMTGRLGGDGHFGLEFNRRQHLRRTPPPSQQQQQQQQQQQLLLLHQQQLQRQQSKLNFVLPPFPVPHQPPSAAIKSGGGRNIIGGGRGQ